jgi:hypothetical protein
MNENIALATARIVASFGLKTPSEALEAFDAIYDHVARKMSNPVVTITSEQLSPPDVRIGTTSGGRKMPIVNQSEIQSKIDGAKVIPVHKARDIGVPDDAIEWAEKRGIKFLLDNRLAQKENPKRPAFVGVGEDGSHIKTEDGKSLSFWGGKKWEGPQKYES